MRIVIFFMLEWRPQINANPAGTKPLTDVYLQIASWIMCQEKVSSPHAPAIREQWLIQGIEIKYCKMRDY